MVIRELKNGSCWVSTQEDHAELSAQFAAHWGNDKFSRLRPYNTVVLATTFHDSATGSGRETRRSISPKDVPTPIARRSRHLRR